MTAADTIVVVDDNESVRAMLRAGLESAGWQVVLCDSGDGVPALVAERPVAAVVLDIVMADKEGIETLIEIKAEQPGLPVIMVSSYADYLPMAQMLGADAVLEKPLDLGELLCVLRKLLGRQSPD